MFGILSLSAWKIVCWTMRRDIHSIWIISKAALDIEGRWEKLLTVSASHLRVSPWDFPPWLTHKAHTKYLIFNTLSLNINNGILCTRRDISIHCSWSVPKPSLDVLSRWYELLYASFCHSWISLIYFPLSLTLKMHMKCQILSTLSVRKIGSYYIMRDDHCLWSASKPSSNAWDRWEELLCASFYCLWFSSSYVSPKLNLINCTKYHMLGTPSQYLPKWLMFSMTRDIHCLWSVSKSSLDTQDRYEKLLLASVYLLLVPPSHFLPRLALKLHMKCHISDTLSSVQKIWYYGILNYRERYP